MGFNGLNREKEREEVKVKVKEEEKERGSEGNIRACLVSPSIVHAHDVTGSQLFNIYTLAVTLTNYIQYTHASARG